MFKFFTRLIAIGMFLFGIFLLAYGFTSPVVVAGGPLIGGALLFIGSFFVWRLSGKREETKTSEPSAGGTTETQSQATNEKKEESENYCPSCGEPVGENMTYCPNCGEKISE